MPFRALLCVLAGIGPLVAVPVSAVAEQVQRRSGQQWSSDVDALGQETLDSLLRPVFIDKMADFYVAGAAIAVVHDGEIVYRGGFGDREVYWEVSVDPERTIFRIGSVTKVLTGVAVMQLVDRGLLDLDADVNDYLTELEVPRTFDEPVRVRHLLTHTAGFDQIGTGRRARSRAEVRPLGEFLAENLVRIRPPDEISTYDTYAITLAGYLVEQVSGLSYEEYLRRQIFEPLEMERSNITVPPTLEPDVAVGYEFRGEWFSQRWEYMNTDPASTVNATVVNMANFAIMLLQGGEFRGRRVLSEASARAMLTRQYTNHPEQPGYGYTFFEDRSFGVPGWSHGGSMTGYGSFLWLAPEHDLGVFIAYNQESDRLASVVLSRLVAALFPDRRAEPELRARWTGPLALERFAGRYANSMHNHTNPTVGWRRRPFEIEVTADGGIVFQGAPAYPVGPLSFQREDGQLLTFEEDGTGAVRYLFVNQTVYERLSDGN